MGTLVTLIPPHTGVDPHGVHHLYCSVLVSPGEVTRHRMTCYFALLYIPVLLQVTQGAHADDDPYLRQARLCLRSSHGHAAQRDEYHANETGSASRGLTGSSGELGGRKQLSQSRAPQALHCSLCAAAGFCCRARGSGDPRTMASGSSEGAAG